MTEYIKSTPITAPIHADLRPKPPCVATIAQALQGVLADLMALQHQLHTHQERQVVFDSARLYEFLDAQEMELRATIREVRAHLRVLHESLPHDLEEMTGLPPSPLQEMTHDAVLRDLISIYQTARARLQCALKLSEREGDMLTASILQERIEEHDLSTHMIRHSFGDLLPQA